MGYATWPLTGPCSLGLVGRLFIPGILWTGKSRMGADAACSCAISLVPEPAEEAAPSLRPFSTTCTKRCLALCCSPTLTCLSVGPFSGKDTSDNTRGRAVCERVPNAEWDRCYSHPSGPVLRRDGARTYASFRSLLIADCSALATSLRMAAL